MNVENLLSTDPEGPKILFIPTEIFNLLKKKHKKA